MGPGKCRQVPDLRFAKLKVMSVTSRQGWPRQAGEFTEIVTASESRQLHDLVLSHNRVIPRKEMSASRHCHSLEIH